MLRCFKLKGQVLHLTNMGLKSPKIARSYSSSNNNNTPDKDTIIDLSKKVRLTPAQKRKKTAELAKTSLLDIFDFASNGTADDLNYKDPLDMAKVLSNPKLFATLSFNQQEQVIDNLDHYRYNEWTDIPEDAKKLMYFISYGNWGPRKSFKDPLTDPSSYIPEDIPFKVGSLKMGHPRLETKVSKLPSVNLMLASKEREALFNKDVRSLDPMSQVIVVFAFSVTIIAILRDKFFNDEQKEEEETKAVVK